MNNIVFNIPSGKMKNIPSGKLLDLFPGDITQGDITQKLLLHFDGSDTGTTFTDDSIYTNTVTAHGDAETSTDQYKWTSSYYGTTAGGGYLTIPDSNEFNFGVDVWTIDFWLYLTDLSKDQYVLNYEDSSASHMRIFYDTLASQFRCTIANGPAFLSAGVASSANLTINTWNHIAVQRTSIGYFQLFVNGTRSGNINIGTVKTLANMSSDIYIGSNVSGTENIEGGYIDELRILIGRNGFETGSTITVPTSPYSLV